MPNLSPKNRGRLSLIKSISDIMQEDRALFCR
jgi:hypothetical protein